jgi:hypothetical protein
MDYAEVRAVFFGAPDPAAPPAGTAAWQSPARRLRDAIEPIAMLYCWSKPSYDAYAACGLDVLTGYVWSRACVLGEPDASVVAAAFGVFEPGLVGGVYAAARAACGLDAIRAAREAGATAAIREALGAPEKAGEVTAILRRALQAADPTARPLFAGLAALPWPADELGQLWHACNLLRELRGDSHLAACATAALSGLEANLLTELQVGWPPLSYTASRGWSPEAMNRAMAALTARGLVTDGALSPTGTQLRAGIEQVTDIQLMPVLAEIGPVLEEIIPLLDDWSQQIIAHGWFPEDPYKRASG